jgi:hypothetical protein
MSNLCATIKSIQDVMRHDSEVDDDAWASIRSTRNFTYNQEAAC